MWVTEGLPQGSRGRGRGRGRGSGEEACRDTTRKSYGDRPLLPISSSKGFYTEEDEQREKEEEEILAHLP